LYLFVLFVLWVGEDEGGGEFGGLFFSVTFVVFSPMFKPVDGWVFFGRGEVIPEELVEGWVEVEGGTVFFHGRVIIVM
jgi:hypothetical protein